MRANSALFCATSSSTRAVSPLICGCLAWWRQERTNQLPGRTGVTNVRGRSNVITRRAIIVQLAAPAIVRASNLMPIPG